MSQGLLVHGAQPSSMGRKKRRVHWLAATALCGVLGSAALPAAPAFADGVVVISETGPITISNSGNVTNDNGAGISATITGTGATGPITMDLSGDISGTTEGIIAENRGTGGVDINIGSGGDVIGGTTGIQANIGSGTGTINIEGGATVTGPTAIGVKSTGGGTFTVNNSGTLSGAIRSEGSATNLTLTNSGTWIYDNNVTSVLQGNDQIINNGTLRVSGTANFDGLEKFTNNGTVDLRNGNPTDRVVITGDATLNGTVRLDVDLRSGQGVADLIQVGGNTDGTVTLDLGLGNGGVPLGGLFDQPIFLVDGNSGDLNFTNDPRELGTFGIIDYVLNSSNGDIFITSELNNQAASPPSIPQTLSAVAAIFHKPSSAFTTGCNDPGPNQRGFGTWGRANGGSIDTQLSSRSSLTGPEIQSKNRTDYFGIQAGFDTAFCNIDNNDLTIHTGLTGGYVFGTSDQLNGGLSVDFDSYFAGLYGALAKGSFSTEITLRYDDHSFDLAHDDPTVIAPGTDSGGDTYSAMLVGSYEFSLSELTKLIPSVGVTLSNTNIDSIATSGGVVDFDDLLSVMGYAGLTATTTIPVKNNVFLLPFASATLYNEFAKDGKSGFTIGLTTADVKTERIGTFGQVGLGINAAVLGNTAMNEPNIYGSLRVDAQVGDRIQGWGVTGAVRVQF